MGNTPHGSPKHHPPKLPFRFTLIEDDNGNLKMPPQELQRIRRILDVRHCLSTINDFYSLISDNEKNKVSYLQERTRVFDKEFIKLIKDKLRIDPTFNTVFLSMEFPLSCDGDVEKIIYKSLFVEKLEHKTNKFRVEHECSIIGTRSKFYSPSPIDICDRLGKNMLTLKETILKETSLLLLEKHPLTRTELDILEYYGIAKNDDIKNLLKINKVIAQMQGKWTPETVRKHKDSIRKKGEKIAPGLSNIDQFYEFYEKDKMI